MEDELGLKVDEDRSEDDVEYDVGLNVEEYEGLKEEDVVDKKVGDSCTPELDEDIFL